jgi:hypothetical protein
LDHTSDILSPLTEISDDDDDALPTDDIPDLQEVVINTNFNLYLEENRKFPCGRSEEERLVFTKMSRESVEEHTLTPSTLEELTSLVFKFFPSSGLLLLSILKLQDKLKTGKRENPLRDFIRIDPNILNGYTFFLT